MLTRIRPVPRELRQQQRPAGLCSLEVTESKRYLEGAITNFGAATLVFDEDEDNLIFEISTILGILEMHE